MNAIRDWMLVGKYRDTLDYAFLLTYGVGTVLQLAEAFEYPNIESLYLPVEDGVPLADKHLREGVDFILSRKRQGCIVLVACGAGMSRSAAFAVAALKKKT